MLVFSSLFSSVAFPQVGKRDHTFNPGTGFDGIVRSTCIQPDGKIIAGGQFNTLNTGTLRYRIARMNTDGTLDASFNAGTMFENTIWSVSLQPDGKIILGSSYNTINGASRSYVARLNTNGTLDTDFNPTGTGFNNVVYATLIQPDGKIIVAGEFTSFNGTSIGRIARLNADGTLDISFAPPGTGFSGTIRSICLQSDGKILVGGHFTSFNETSIGRIARLNADGTLDASFVPTGTGFGGSVRSISLQPDGKIIAGGEFSFFNGIRRNRIGRLNTDGSFDTDFNPGTGFDNAVHSTCLQPDGKIIVGGDFEALDGTSRNRIARLNADGTPDASFNPSGTGFNNAVYSISLQSDGKIVTGGQFVTFNGTSGNRIARLLNCTAPAKGTDVITACTSSYTWIDGITYMSSNNTATHTIPNGAVNGCDSIVTLNLTIGDVMAPVPDVATLADITAECEVTALTAPTATDNCAGTVTATHNITLPVTAPGTTTITWTYDDGNGNTSTQTQRMILENIYVDESVEGSGTGTCWETAFKTLKEALDLAALNDDIKNIYVAKGTYYPTGAQNSTDRNATFLIPQRGGIKIYGGYPSGGGAKNITVNPAILSGDIGTPGSNGDNSYHVLVITNTSAAADSIVIDGLTITGGNANGGGGVQHTYNGIVTNQNEGGGLLMRLNNNISDKLAVRNCTVTGNNAISASGVYLWHSSPTITHCMITNNTAINNGGGFFLYEAPGLKLINSVVASNSAANGGGM